MFLPFVAMILGGLAGRHLARENKLIFALVFSTLSGVIFLGILIVYMTA